MKELKDDVLGILKQLAYKKGEYTLSSGRKTDHYINCKPVVLNGRGLTLASFALLEYIDTQAVGGLTLGADPLVCSVAMKSWMNKDGKKLSALIVRKEAKGHGTEDYIEGPLPEKDSTITVLEDVVTTGGSAIKAVKRLREAGYKVNRIVSIVDRQENGEADTAMKLAGLELRSLFTEKDFVE